MNTTTRIRRLLRLPAAPRINFVLGDITQIKADVIVNAAKRTLLGGGGVDGAIHDAAGPGLLAECRQLRKDVFPDGLPVGNAAVTSAYQLPAKYVVHTVGPQYERQPYEALLRSCYIRSLRVADRLEDVQSISFPLISAGVYGWPVPGAIVAAVAAIQDTRCRNVKTANLVFFDARTYDLAHTICGHSF